jgi:cephalosporin-C deacetylase-like acetyl esterase
MAPYDNTTPETRLDSFNVYETHFKQIGDHKINVAILVPKDLKPSKVPLAIKFHGGGLVSYTSCPHLFPPTNLTAKRSQATPYSPTGSPPG